MQSEAKAKALEQFTDYFVKNYPGPDTIIYNPNWHAPKIFAAAYSAITAALSDKQAVEVNDAAVNAAARVHDHWTGDGTVGAMNAIRNTQEIVQSYLGASRSALVDVPAVEPVGEAGEMPGSNGGFTMAVFKASDVPLGTKLYRHPPLSREGEDSAEVERLRGLLDVALEALDTYSYPTSYLDNDGEPLPADAEIHEGIHAKETASSIRAALAATRSGSATSAKTWGEWEREKQSEEDQ